MKTFVDRTGFAMAAAGVFLVALDSTVMTASFPALRAHFADVSPGELSWVLNAYTLVYAALLAPLGGWADRRGHHRAFLGGIVVFCGASAACGLASSPGLLILARAAQAVGAALLTPASLALALTAFPKEKRAVAASVWGAVGALTAAVGPAGGSWLIEAVSWRAIFWVNVPVGAMIGWRAWKRLKPSPATPSPDATPVDWIGAGLLIAGAGSLILGITNAGEPGGTLERRQPSGRCW